MAYGMKTTVTCVVNDGKYDLGFTYNDSDGNAIDKQLNGNVDNIASDIASAAFDTYFDLKKSTNVEKKPEKVAKTSTPKVKSYDDKFAELEDENRRLNKQIDDILAGRSAQKETPRESKPHSIEDYRRNGAVGERVADELLSDEIRRLMRILGM